MRRMPTGLEYLGILFLVAQMASVAYAVFIPEKFFAWAPFDVHVHYVVTVQVGERTLDWNETRFRYNYLPEAWEARSIYNVFSIIEQYESTYGAADSAVVTVDYSVNGRPREIWTWPRE